MVELTDAEAPEITKARRMNMWATALMALAFAAPFIATGTGFSNYYKAGERFSYVLLALAVFMTVGGIFTRKGSHMAKARARLMVGIILLLGIGSNIAFEVSEEQAAKQFLKDIVANEARQEQLFADLGKRGSNQL